MAPPSKLSATALTSAAIGLVDMSGLDALTISAVAGQLQVAPSALYTHCNGLDGLRNLVAVAATNNLTSHVRNAAIGTSGDNALNAMGGAYRHFAQTYPGQFASTLRPPAAENEDLARADQSLLEVFTLVYVAMGLDKDRSHLAARSTRSAIHGFLALEHNTGTLHCHPEEYQHLLDTLQRGLRRDT